MVTNGWFFEFLPWLHPVRSYLGHWPCSDRCLVSVDVYIIYLLSMLCMMSKRKFDPIDSKCYRLFRVLYHVVKPYTRPKIEFLVVSLFTFSFSSLKNIFY